MVGVTAALIGSAALSAGASAIGASSNNKAINRATDAQVQANRDSLALQSDIYDRNNALLSPFVARGNAAGESINALLGLPTGGAAAPSISGGVDWSTYLAANPDVLQGFYTTADRNQFSSPTDYAQWHYANYGAGEGRAFPTPAATASSSVTPTSATNAFNNYLDSAGYKFQLGEMNDAANAQFRAAGALDSGAAVKAAQERAQNLGTNFFNNYLSLLGNQQGVGLSGASAVAGVGQNYANNVTGINQNNANALANAATAKAGNTNALLGNLSSSFGLGLGAMSGFGNQGVYGGALGSIY